MRAHGSLKRTMRHPSKAMRTMRKICESHCERIALGNAPRMLEVKKYPCSRTILISPT